MLIAMNLLKRILIISTTIFISVSLGGVGLLPPCQLLQ